MPKPPVAPLAGPRVRLRLLAPADLPTTLRWRNQDHVRTRFVSADVIAPDQHDRWFRGYAEKADDFLFVIELPGPPPRPVGQVGLYRIDPAAGTAEFGRLMIGEADAAGRGLAGEATALVLDWAFDALGLRAVELEVFADNDRAVRLYERSGFARIGGGDRLQRMRVAADTYRATRGRPTARPPEPGVP